MSAAPVSVKAHHPGWRARLIALGEFFFRQRSWTPIPFIIFLVVCTFKPSRDAITWIPGLIFLLFGEGLRLWGVAVVGKESRTRGSGTARLATYGPYAYVRNPLYVGNFFLTLGATLISELLWMVPVCVALFLMQYIPIVVWEESLLRERFGAQYVAYCRQVPRWVPRWSRTPRANAAQLSYQWRASFWSERSTLGTLTLLLLLMVAKENLRHLPKYLRTHPFSASSTPAFALELNRMNLSRTPPTHQTP